MTFLVFDDSLTDEEAGLIRDAFEALRLLPAPLRLQLLRALLDAETSESPEAR